MPLVFVHGVNTRRGVTEDAPETQVYENRVAFMREHFRRVSFGAGITSTKGLHVEMPYWGDLGATFGRNMACLPRKGVQALTTSAPPEEQPFIEAVSQSLDGDMIRDPGATAQPLLTIARIRSFNDAIDLLSVGIATAPVSGNLMDAATVLTTMPRASEFVERARQYAKMHPEPAWLATIADDDEFLQTLFTVLATFSPQSGVNTLPQTDLQSLDVFGDLRNLAQNAVGKIKRVFRDVIGSVSGALGDVATSTVRSGYMLASDALRPSASAVIGRFLGDIFVYMQDPEPIVNRVLIAVDKAVANQVDGDRKLYLLGHSFGGIILYDIVTKYRPDLACETLVTVGSQVALFAELGRLADRATIAAVFASSANAVVPRPANVRRWLNVYDPTDFIGFGTDRVFSGTTDFEFNTGAMPLVSHGAYFDVPRFHERLRTRLETMPG